MRALSVSQPWASIIVHGPKRIENRPLQLLTTATRLIGETIAIHAAKSYDPAIAVEQARRELGLPPERKLPRGAVIGTARIADALIFGEVAAKVASGAIAADQDRWTTGPLCIVLADVVALERPIPCRGMLGFWTVPAEVEHAIARGGR